MKVLLLENIHPVAKEKLESAGFEVDLLTHSPEHLLQQLITHLLPISVLVCLSDRNIFWDLGFGV